MRVPAGRTVFRCLLPILPGAALAVAGLEWAASHYAGDAGRPGVPAAAAATVLPPVEPTRFKPVAAADARAINAATPLAPSAGPAARPFRPLDAVGDAARAQDCLAAAAFFEAGDDAEGERAVAQVVLNRVHHPAFPKTVCGVVFQGAARRTGCQFTFTCDGSMDRRVPSPSAWARARAVATAALGGAVYAPVGLATHYHADWVVPYWSARLDKIAAVGPHIFYRWTGWWGTPAAFRGQERGAEPAVSLLAGLSGVHGTGAELGGEQVHRGPVRPALYTASDPDVFLVRLRQGEAGSYPVRARELCENRDACTVLGWTDPRLVARALPLSPEQMDGLAFRYGRDSREGPKTILWDCARAPRADASQCLRPGLLPAVPLARRDAGAMGESEAVIATGTDAPTG